MWKLRHILLLLGISFLGTYLIFTVKAFVYQERMQDQFDQMIEEPSVPMKGRILNEGDLVGRLEIPRLDLSVMVLEGVSSSTLRLGAGHIPGTAFPQIKGGNVGIAAHRDTFFRPLSKIQTNDEIRFSTPEDRTTYRVSSTQIVDPNDVAVLHATGRDTLTLVTCYPFYYVGPAPKRFIVTAVKE